MRRCNICQKKLSKCDCGYVRHLGLEKKVVEVEKTEDKVGDDLEEKTVKELHQVCKDKNLSGYSRKTKDELIKMIETAE